MRAATEGFMEIRDETKTSASSDLRHTVFKCVKFMTAKFFIPELQEIFTNSLVIAH